ncbi:MAG TPA: hypothetical protein HA254_04270 [Candidatus Diapherotrites archaeon]|uniref:Uncharacterized protein n=1 Tax=Candidatus Iainarchaeum sp. TaxID=3101447 RepID=A0A7J4J034_9ARCH|nr:hypothetical protein [Candidatus Diapherotrites archaeon]
MRVTLVIACLLLALSTATFAAQDPTGNVILTQNKALIDSSFENGKLKQPVVDGINSRLGSVPEGILALFGNSRTNVYVEFDDATVQSYWAIMKNNRLKEVASGARGEADAEIKVKESTIERISFSADPVSEFTAAINSGEITYNGLSPQGQVQGIFVRVSSVIFDILNKLARLVGIAK